MFTISNAVPFAFKAFVENGIAHLQLVEQRIFDIPIKRAAVGKV